MARQTSARAVRKPLAAPAGSVAQRKPPLTLPAAATLSNDLRTLAVNLTILAAIILILPVVGAQFLRNQILIEPIVVPQALQASGLTPEVAANRLWDGLQEIQKAADTAKGGVNAVPDSQRVDFSIPDSGLSIDALIYYVRQFFHVYETRISGEFRCADATCAPDGITLRLRVVREGLELVQLPQLGASTEAEYFRDAAAELLSVIDPFVALAAQSSTEPDKARVLAQRLILTAHPDAKWAHNLLGNLSMDQGRLVEAKAEYNAALAIDGGFLPALVNLGNVLRIEGDLAGARTAYKAVDMADPGNVFAALGFADLALLEGKQDDAIALLLAASRRDPLSPHYLFRAGAIEFERNNVEAARELFTDALAIDPTDTGSLSLLSVIHLLAGALASAARLYRPAAAFAPQNAEILAEPAKHLSFLQSNDDALARIDAAIALAPDSVPYRVKRAELLQQLDRPDEALAELLAVQEIAPDNADTTFLLGVIHNALGHRSDALAVFRRFIELSPEDPRAGAVALWITELERPVAESAFG